MSLTPPAAPEVNRASRGTEILSAQVRLLYASANLGFGITALAAAILGCLQWGTVPKAAVIGWWFFMAAVSLSRFALSVRFRRVLAGDPSTVVDQKWRIAFAVGAGLAGIGWGAAGSLLYPEGYLGNQVFLVFVLGGMMLGAASLLAPRPETYLAFLTPTGLILAIRLLIEGDRTHVAMGILAIAFTIATVVTTGRIYRTIDAALRLQFDNRDLVEDLQIAKKETEILNQELERRVQERTAELQKSTEHLRAEIAQRELMEEELLRARKLESLGVMAGGIAHDFNNFLTIVQGNLELAKGQLNSQEPVQEMLNEAASASRRAAFLSSQLLTFAKGGAPVRRAVSIAKLVSDAVRLARTEAVMSISVNMADDVGFAEVDAGQIAQVLQNILLNARQAMAGGGLIEIHVKNVVLQGNHEAEPFVRISIRDFGCGIPADQLPQIFDPYFTTKPGASGLGLATSYAIVAKHGGRISVNSKPGEGATFTIDLPASRETPAPPVPVATHVKGASGRLLVMDDEEALRNLLKRILATFGYEVQTARDGAEAIALYEEAMSAGRGFSAVLLDLTVSGGMGGAEAASKLKELDPSAKLIVSSGYSDAPVMSDFAKHGFDAVIPKPWTATELNEVFQKVLVPDRKSR